MVAQTLGERSRQANAARRQRQQQQLQQQQAMGPPSLEAVLGAAGLMQSDLCLMLRLSGSAAVEATVADALRGAAAGASAPSREELARSCRSQDAHAALQRQLHHHPATAAPQPRLRSFAVPPPPIEAGPQWSSVAVMSRSSTARPCHARDALVLGPTEQRRWRDAKVAANVLGFRSVDSKANFLTWLARANVSTTGTHAWHLEDDSYLHGSSADGGDASWRDLARRYEHLRHDLLGVRLRSMANGYLERQCTICRNASGVVKLAWPAVRVSKRLAQALVTQVRAGGVHGHHELLLGTFCAQQRWCSMRLSYCYNFAGECQRGWADQMWVGAIEMVGGGKPGEVKARPYQGAPYEAGKVHPALAPRAAWPPARRVPWNPCPNTPITPPSEPTCSQPGLPSHSPQAVEPPLRWSAMLAGIPPIQVRLRQRQAVGAAARLVDEPEAEGSGYYRQAYHE